MKTVLILTIARSGSSLLAGILYHLGVNLGPDKDMKRGKHLNIYGCYENQEFLKITLNILFEARMLIDYTRRINIPKERLQKIITKNEKKIKKAIRRHQNDIWGFKIGTLIYYLSYIENYFTNSYYIHLERNHEHTAKSILSTFKKSNWKEERKEKFSLFPFLRRIRIILRIAFLSVIKARKKSLLTIQEVVSKGHFEINNFLINKRSIKVTLDEIITNPEITIYKLSNFLEINPTEEQVKQAINFIHPELLNY